MTTQMPKVRTTNRKANPKKTMHRTMAKKGVTPEERMEVIRSLARLARRRILTEQLETVRTHNSPIVLAVGAVTHTPTAQIRVTRLRGTTSVTFLPRDRTLAPRVIRTVTTPKSRPVTTLLATLVATRADRLVQKKRKV